MQLPSPGFILDAFLQVCRRFPAVMLCAVAGVATVITYISPNGFQDERDLERLWMVFQMGLPLFAGIVSFSESRGWSERRGLLAQVAGLAVLAAYWFVLAPGTPVFEYVTLPQYFALLTTAHLFVAVAPYLNTHTVRNFWEYNRDLFAGIIIGAVFTLILYAGLALAILAVNELFSLSIDNRIYGKLFVFLAGIFNTVYFLYHFPKTYEFETSDTAYNTVFKNLCKYILIPIVGLYFLILYAYGAKILVTWTLPHGWVSSLVLGFSVAGIFTYLLNFYLAEHDDSAWVSAYRKWFWWTLLPLTVLLFVAIGRRIGDYGVTEPRFLVAHLGVWLAAACLYFLLSKHDNIKFIPISLCLFALAFAFGPFSAFRVAERSQVGILKGLLEQNERLKNGRLVRDTSAVPMAEAGQIISALEFLERRDALRRLGWLPMPVDSFPQQPGTYNTAGRIAAWAGINVRSSTGDSDFLNVSSPELPASGADIRGFSNFYLLNMNQYREEKPERGYLFNLSPDNRHLEWQEAKAGAVSVVETFDLQPVLRKWAALQREPTLELKPEEARFDLTGKKGVLRVYVTEVRVEKEKGELKVDYLNGYLFLREK